HRLAAPQHEEGGTRRRPPGRSHPQGRPNAGAAAEAPGRQPDAALLELRISPVSSRPSGARAGTHFSSYSLKYGSRLGPVGPSGTTGGVPLTLQGLRELYMSGPNGGVHGRRPMKRKQQDYDDIPGTFVFDAERSREGFGINMFCMSLMKDENRKAFKANEAEYLKRFKLTPEQTEAILQRDYNRMLELGSNIYFTANLGATDGHSFRHLAAVMTGSTQEDYAAMMLAGGRSAEGNRSKSGHYLASTLVPGDRSKAAKSKAAKPKSKAKKSSSKKLLSKAGAKRG